MTEQHRRELGYLAEDLRKLYEKYTNGAKYAVQPSKKRVFGDKAARYRRQLQAVLAALDTPPSNKTTTGSGIIRGTFGIPLDAPGPGE